MLVIVFTGLNSLIIMPYLAYILDKVLEEDIEKSQAIKRALIGIVIFIICIILERNYLTQVQQGILNMYSEVQNAKG